MRSIRRDGAAGAFYVLAAVSTACSSADDGTAGGSGQITPAVQPSGPCEPGSTAQCAGGPCSDGQASVAACNAQGGYDPCSCPTTGGAGGIGSGAAGSAPSVGAGGAAGTGTGAGTGGAAAASGSGGSPAGGSGGAGGSESPAGENIWAMMGRDSSNQYFNPAETTLSPSNAGSLVEKWRFTVSGYPPGSPVIADGKVFVMATGGTYAIDLQTGAEAWSRTDLRGTASLAYDGGFIYAHTTSAELHKLNAADGMTVWGGNKTYALAGCDGTSSPIVAGDVVIVGHSCGALEVGAGGGQAMARGGVEAHDVATGDKAWTYFTVPESGENGAMVWSSVAIDVAGGSVFASTGNNYTLAGANSDSIHAIALSDGMKKWTTQVREGDIWSIPSFMGGPDTDFGANPILAEIGGMQVVAAGDKGSAFWVMDRATGNILWQREDLSSSHNPANGGVLMNGAFDGTYFYVVSNQPPNASVLRALDPAQDGADAWPAKTFDKLAWGAPSLANGVMVVPVDDDLYVFDAHSGDMLTMFNTGGTIAAGAAAIAEGRIVVQSGLQYAFAATAKNNNQVICYGLP